jgi:CubicO group peptidase (beta-lactamase class C family)
VYEKALGDLDKATGTAMHKDAIFPIASMTKPFTVVAALQLIEKGALMISEPVGTYLPELARMSVVTSTGTQAPKRKPTTHDMMRHTAGVNYPFGNSELDKLYAELSPSTLTSIEFLEKLGKLPLHYEPGTAWEYGFGLEVTGLIVEAITKQRLGDYLQAHVFGPLNMRDTSFGVPASKMGRVARPLPASLANANRGGFDCGGQCAYSTAADYLRFAEMLRLGGKLGNTRLLARKTVEFMTSDQLGPEVNIASLRARHSLNGAYGFGLGVAVRRVPGLAGIMGSTGDYHWGGGGGTYFWVDPKEQLTVVLMARASGEGRLHLRQLITTLVYQAIED